MTKRCIAGLKSVICELLSEDNSWIIQSGRLIFDAYLIAKS